MLYRFELLIIMALLWEIPNRIAAYRWARHGHGKSWFPVGEIAFIMGLASIGKSGIVLHDLHLRGAVIVAKTVEVLLFVVLVSAIYALYFAIGRRVGQALAERDRWLRSGK
jgi:hypothetical protein